jgi:HlyD family secretion protein
MTRPTPAFAALAVLAAAACTLSACHRPAATKAAEPEGRAVSVARVEAQPVRGALAASGDLVPLEEAAVLPEVTGFRVAAVLADAGQYVKKGQVLAKLDPALIESQLAQQQALAAQAEAQAIQAEDQAERVRGLDSSGVLSEEQIRQRRFQARAARATAQAQAAALRDIRTRAAKLEVAAPVSGLVLEKSVRPGDLATAGSSPWFRLARDGVIELQAQMSEDDLARVHSGQHAQVTLPSGAVVTGTVRLVSPQIDPQSKLGFVRITLPTREDVRAGGFGRAVFIDSSGRTLAVPETAVRYDADGASVMVVGADNRVRRVPVRTGLRGGGLVQLVQGPPSGVRVVQNAGSFLLEGDRVRPVEGAARPAAAAQ